MIEWRAAGASRARYFVRMRMSAMQKFRPIIALYIRNDLAVRQRDTAATTLTW